MTGIAIVAIVFVFAGMMATQMIRYMAHSIEKFDDDLNETRND